MTFLVLGATGKTGRHVATALRARGADVRPASRAAGFDWHQPSTWDGFLDGAEGVYLVETDEDPGLVADLAKRAAAAGVRRIVLLSARSGDPINLAMKADSERGVADAGVAWTSLRPAWFTQNFAELPLFAEPLATGVLALPTGDGRESFIDARDIAEVAVAALLDDGHAGQTYVLTGPRAMTFAEFLTEYGAATGRPLRYEPISEEDYAAGLLAVGVPEEATTLLNSLFREIRTGGGESISPHVEQILGRPPLDPSVWIKEQA